MILLAIFVLISIAGAGLFSGVETAFLACPRLKVRHLARKGLAGAKSMEQALQKPEPYLTSLLVGTNMSVIGGTVAATRLFDRVSPGRGEVLATLILTPVFLVLSEILPKSYFLAHARTLCVPLSRPLGVLRMVLGPLAMVASAPARLVCRRGGGAAVSVSREELLLLVRPGVSSVRLSGTISRLLEGRIATAQRIAGDVMVPRERVVALPADVSLADVIPTVRGTGLPLYPLERGGWWIGFIHVFDLLESRGAGPLSKLASPLPEVDQDAGLEKIIETMRASAEHVVAVVHGGVQVGIITLEDIVNHMTVGLEARS
ncbi:DUF21 domain-containing protein [Candidatus Fermentibacteria bacterium]|nr:DUF21 domain-containing protein [Candidatus Fermentibacteria bacterium]